MSNSLNEILDNKDNPVTGTCFECDPENNERSNFGSCRVCNGPMKVPVAGHSFGSLEDTMELNEQTKKEIELARKEFKEGKTISHAQVKKELGL